MVGVAEEMAGPVEPVAEEHAHGRETHLGTKRWFRFRTLTPAARAASTALMAAREVDLEEIHRPGHAWIELSSVGPGFRGQLAEGMDHEEADSQL